MPIDVLIKSRRGRFVGKLIGLDHFQDNTETVNFTLNNCLADNVDGILTYCMVVVVYTDLLFISCVCVFAYFVIISIVCAVDADE